MSKYMLSLFHILSIRIRHLSGGIQLENTYLYFFRRNMPPAKREPELISGKRENHPRSTEAFNDRGRCIQLSISLLNRLFLGAHRRRTTLLARVHDRQFTEPPLVFFKDCA